MRQASITDRRLDQAGAFSALQRYLTGDPGAPVSFLNGLIAPLYTALMTCRSEVPTHAVIALLEAHLGEDAPGNMTETS